MRVDHTPQGDPCVRCNQPFRAHRVEHIPQGDPCAYCNLPAENHRKTRRDSEQRYYAGIDGEGQGRKNHRYVMLAWSSADGTKRESLEVDEGGSLSTEDCLDFILDVPNHAKLFAFAFGYDLTKILADMPDDLLYLLVRPELRARPPGKEKLGPKPVEWKGYSLNKIASKFSVAWGKRRRVVWDTFAFYQAKFTSACTDWKVGTSEAIARMVAMKDRRADFDKLERAQILEYCYQECAYMAELAEKLTQAHENVELKLRSYYGAGSTASVILKKFGIGEARRETPLAMEKAVASAFFGGRFENSRVGEIPGRVWGYDISSAYPYQLTFLPCLDHGSWHRTRKREKIDGARAALVRYSLDETGDLNWGPFPFRLKTGAIAFPSASGGGWVWQDEYLQGEKLFPNAVKFHEAWVYRCECDHQPFAKVPEYYRERLRIGKEGPGIVLKLGCNSIYGKLAQSIGGSKPPYQCWIWAGMITSGCRAQALEMLALHKDRSNLIMVATDGIYTREEIETPKPRETGTLTEHRKPLGGWECKLVDGGMFAARPGIYFPLNTGENDLKSIRARGIGRAVMLAQTQKIIEGWKSGQEKVRFADVTRFYGIKSSISRSGKPGAYVYQRSENYGQWRTRPLEMSFSPLPKRERARKDGSLVLRAFPGETSEPYKKSVISLDALLLKMATEEANEQPDGHDFVDYEQEGFE